MMGLGWQELVIVLVIIMIIFGAGKLPDVARSLGMGVKEFKQEAGKPMVRLVPADTVNRPRIAGLDAGELWMADDFNAELPDEFWFPDDESADES